MRVFDLLFRKRKIKSLASKLCSLDEPEFLSGLTEAVSYAPRGRDIGIAAMTQAMKTKSGNPYLVFYEVNMGSLKMRQVSEVLEAEDTLLSIAADKGLLDNPARSQNLISALMGVLKPEGLSSLAQKVLAAGGVDQFFSFQLLYNHLHSRIHYLHAKGERTWTEKNEGVS